MFNSLGQIKRESQKKDYGFTGPALADHQPAPQAVSDHLQRFSTIN
ncbi:hypothetical protein METHPM2_80004 [Pseudomonas sp. PM2]